jgi:phage-related protein
MMPDRNRHTMGIAGLSSNIHLYVFMYNETIRPLVWMGSSRNDIRAFPQAVRREVGKALFAAQAGETDPAAKPLKGFGGGSVLEVVARHDGGTWRAVYTVRFDDAVYVLHAFQKKSRRGRATPKQEMELVRQRLKEAERMHRERQN